MVGVFGVQGWVKVQSYTRPGSNILKYRRWRIGDSPREVEEGRPHGPGFVARLKGLDDRDEALKLAGLEITVPRSELPRAKKGEVYWSDLMGFSVVSEQGIELGVLKELTDNGAQDVMVVESRFASTARRGSTSPAQDGGAGVSGDDERRARGGESGIVNERLIPYVVGPIVKALDKKGRKIIVAWDPAW